MIISDNIEWFKVADKLYQFRYKHHYTLFAITSKGVVAFDPLSDEAAEYYIKAIKNSRSRVTVYCYYL